MNHDLFSHFTKVDKLLRRQARYAVREYDFTENEVLVITVLTNQKHITTASAIARFRGISKGLVAKSVDSLTEKGYLIQNKDLKDIVIGWKEISRRYKHFDVSWLYDVEFELLNNKTL